MEADAADAATAAITAMHGSHASVDMTFSSGKKIRQCLQDRLPVELSEYIFDLDWTRCHVCARLVSVPGGIYDHRKSFHVIQNRPMVSIRNGTTTCWRCLPAPRACPPR